MEAIRSASQMSPCGSPLPELEVPMINTMVRCLGSEHRTLEKLIVELAFAATRLAADPEASTANRRAFEVWDEIRRDLWSHLQVENELVLSWGHEHRAISDPTLAALRIADHELRNLMAALPPSSSTIDSEPQSAGARVAIARTLLAVAQTLDAHVERYDGEVLPSILRALFHRHPVVS